ncbi:hypothetical protein FISHEDRAFT_73351 [Fistulina hepatica ATCC 64428]|uniref:Uncharacterized protein n=1 Tax=Fistulina hepatica ATCC 64428 TaxID=1128425 RepID=A0A0D7AFQ0_9AGAR|nr:hypothetical protein FISHEDRAFT_73351 [Fistulina hepatica ATCC 64428]
MFSSRPVEDLPNLTIQPEHMQYASITGASTLASSSSPVTVPAVPAKRPSESGGGCSQKKPKSVKQGFHAPPEPLLMPPKPSTWFYTFEDAEVDLGLPRQMPQDLRHFFFPPPTLFTNVTSHTHQLTNVMNWLFMCSAWIGHLMSMHQLQGFRHGGTTYVQQHAEEILDHVFPGHHFNQLGPTIIYHGQTLATNCIPPDDILHDIIWEVNEANLHMEVTSLLTLEGKEKNILQVDEFVLPIFPGPEDTTFTFWMPMPLVQHRNYRLSADRWQDRINAVMHLGKHLTAVWDDDTMPEAVLKLLMITDLRAMNLNVDKFCMLEKIIAKYYCEHFYNTFSRPPTIPRCLFDVQY